MSGLMTKKKRKLDKSHVEKAKEKHGRKQQRQKEVVEEEEEDVELKNEEQEDFEQEHEDGGDNSQGEDEDEDEKQEEEEDNEFAVEEEKQQWSDEDEGVTLTEKEALQKQQELAARSFYTKKFDALLTHEDIKDLKATVGKTQRVYQKVKSSLLPYDHIFIEKKTTTTTTTTTAATTTTNTAAPQPENGDEPVAADNKKVALPPQRETLLEYGVKPRLAEMKSLALKGNLEKSLFPLFNSYKDVWYAGETLKNNTQISKCYITHILNHLLHHKDTVAKNTTKIRTANVKKKKFKDQLREDAKRLGKRMKDLLDETPNHPEEPPECRDDGFSRCKVLILLPMKNIAFRVVQEIIQAIPPKYKGQILNKSRFIKEFGPDEDEKMNPKRPEDYKVLFDGNTDDFFRIGIGLTGKTVRLYAPFYNSDIIIASPLGLRTITGHEGEGKTFREYDFLSSVEILVLDQSDMFCMQNWEHVKAVIASLNKIPHQVRNTDFSRIKEWYLNGWGKYYRQTILVSGHINAQLNSLFNAHCHNSWGQIKIRSEYKTGTIANVQRTIRQLFQRIPCDSILDIPDARFNYFRDKLLPKLMVNTENHTLIFIPSYFDFVRVRNYMNSQRMEYVNLSDYSTPQDISRARTEFFAGKTHFMLVTERFHFYRRYSIRGVRNIVFYGLPEYAHFYSEYLNAISEGDNTCIVLFSKFDAFALERIVGTTRCNKLLQATKTTHMFC